MTFQTADVQTRREWLHKTEHVLVSYSDSDGWFAAFDCYRDGELVATVGHAGPYATESEARAALAA